MRKIIYILILGMAMSCDKEEVQVNTGPLYLGAITATGTDETNGEDISIPLAPGTTKIPQDANITVNFSKNIDQSTVSAIKLMKDGSEIPSNVTINGTTATLSPNAPLERGEKFSFLITDQLRAEDGGLFFPNTSITFRAKGYQFEDQVAYWAFEESLIDSVSEVVGTNKGATFDTGVQGKAISFDVVNEAYVLFNPSAVITDLDNFTVSFWVNPEFVDTDASNGIDGVLGLFTLSKKTSFWGNIDLFVENGSNPTQAKMRIHMTNGSSETWISGGDAPVENITDFFGQWTNHMIVYNASTSQFKYYLNGQLLVSKDASLPGPVTFEDAGPIILGTTQFQTNPSNSSAGSQGWASFLTGRMDEVRIFSVPLSDEEVLDLYNAEKP